MNGKDHSKDHPTEEEVDETLEETFPASDPPSWTLGIERPVDDQKEQTAVDPISEGLRRRLQELRNRLLQMHKLLLNMERAAWESAHGKLSGGELLRLLINHEQFAWLHVLSELIVRIDETLEAEDEASTEDARSLLIHGRKLLTPSELGDAFAQKYQAALQRNPDVIMMQKELRETLSAEI